MYQNVMTIVSTWAVRRGGQGTTLRNLLSIHIASRQARVECLGARTIAEEDACSYLILGVPLSCEDVPEMEAADLDSDTDCV